MLGERGGYDAKYMPLLRAVEDRHFWFRARNAMIADLIRQIEPALAPGYRVLEIGCGTGNTLRVLDTVCNRGLVVGMDFLREGLLLARDRVNCPVVQGDVRAAPFLDDVRFEIVGMFDVLEHIDDDCATLRTLRSRMTGDGVLFLTVPAGPALWSAYDVAAGHCRRYRARDLTAKLMDAGFRVEYLSPMMSVLYPLAWLSRRVSGRLRRTENGPDGVTEELRVVPILNEVLFGMLMAESRMVAGRRVLPFGTSLIAIARAH